MENIFAIKPPSLKNFAVVDPDHAKTEDYLNSIFTVKGATAFFTDQFSLGAAAAGGISRYILNNKSEFDTSETLLFNLLIIVKVIEKGKMGEIKGLGSARPETRSKFICGLKEFGIME